MRRRSIPAVLAVATLLFAMACGNMEQEDAGSTQMDEAVSPGDIIAYEGPQTPRNTEWLLRSLNGGGVADGSEITLFHDKAELNVEGGCTGFYVVHELEGDRIRVVKPGLQVGKLGCGKPEAKRQAEEILGIMRDLAQVRATEDRFEIRSESGRVAAFVPAAPAQVDRALVGTEWLVTSLEGGELLPKTEITLEIGSGVLSGSSGCNFYGGDVDKMADGSLAWSGASEMTLIGCSGDKGRQELRYLNLFDGTEAYRVEGDRLKMMNGEGRTTIRFRKEAG